MSEYQLYLSLILIGLIAAAFLLHLPPRRPRTEDDYLDRQIAAAVDRDDDRHWRGGLLYDNPDDPALFVPKRYGLGWSLNFGHPRARLLLVGVLVLVLLLVVTGALFGGSAVSYGCHTPGCSPLP